jgi:hypothetical protein
MEQVSKQMEDAIVKEKQVHDTKQAQKFEKTWDTSSETIRKPDDPLTQQSKSEELDAILDEQIKLSSEEPLPGQEEKPAYKEPTMKPGMVDKMKQSMSQTSHNVQQMGKNVMGMGSEIRQGAKGSMQTMREGMRGMGDDVREATKGSIKDMTEAAKKSMSSSPEARAARHDALAKDDDAMETGDDDKTKPRSKRFSEHRQNSSLL